MVKQKNIIDFDSGRSNSSTGKTLRIPQLVISAQRTAKYHLRELLPRFFSQIDNSLFALADKAESNQHQTLYFDAMREVRLQNEDMCKTFFRELEVSFKLFQAQVDISTPHKNGDLDQIGLVDDDQLEESLAITNMASSAENTYREAIFALTARFNFLIEDVEITNDNNPLRPVIFCNAFSSAAACMDTDIKVRLVVYKLFDKFVVQELGSMYDGINADLIAAGVLPRIKSTICKSADTHGNPARTDETVYSDGYPQVYGSNDMPAGGSQQTDDVFSSIQQMLSQQRSNYAGSGSMGNSGTTAGGSQGVAGGAAGGASAGAIGGTGAGETTAATYAPQDVISALSQLQINSELVLNQDQNKPSATLIKSTLMEEISRLQGNSDSKQITQSDTDTIDIVSMLFDFILDDPTLPDSIKAQIARLQIPLLKVAILDNAFFAMKAHPARQLLNELAYAGSGVENSSAEEDAIYQMVGYVVNRIISEFEENTEIFVNLLSEFTEFMDRERESNKLAEEMLEQAKDLVAKEIQRRVTNNRVPPLVTNILIDAWKDVLIHLYLRDGDESTAWNTALQVADDLIWSVQPKLIVSERQRLIKIIPRVLNGLRDGLTLVRFDREATDQIFSGLEALHLESLRGGIPNTQGQITPKQPQEPTLNLTADDFGMDLSAFPEGNNHGETQYHDDDIMEEIILSSTQQTTWDTDNMEFSQYVEDIKEMSLGTWVEFIDAGTEKHSRGKLAWKCDFTQEFTFVDRKYKVVADLTFRQLVEKFELGQAAIVEDVPLFDRALDSVIVGIKHALDRKGTSTDNSAH